MLRNPGLRKSVEQPVLDLNFAASQIGSNAAPDARIDFSRGSNAYFVDSDGLVKKSPHNLIDYSEAISNWSSNNVTKTDNNIASPVGDVSASRVEVTTASAAFIYRNATTQDGATYHSQIYIKSDDVTWVYFQFSNGTQSEGIRQWVNISTGVAGNQSTLGSNTTSDSFEIVDAGNGWYRLILKGSMTGVTTSRIWVVPVTANGGGTNTASGTAFYVWGAQLSQHTTLPVDNPYIKTEGSAVYAARLDHDPSWFMSAAQEQNLFEYSEMLDDSYWTKDFSGAIANQAADPNGETTAEKLVEDNTASSQHRAKTDVNVTNGLNYTYSLYAKASERSEVRLSFFSTNSAFANTFAQFDLSDGSISSSNTDDATITDVGDGWFRLTATEQATATAEARIVVQIVKDGNVSYDGEGTSTPVAGDPGIFVWGLQFEVGSTASTYHRTTGAPYYGEGATPKGLLIEEARTNLITDSESHTYLDGDILVTQTANSGLAPDGTNTAIAFMETAGTGNHVSRRTGITIADNGNIIFSFFVKANGRTNGAIELFGTGTGGAFVFFNLSTGQITTFGHSAYGGATNLSSSIEDYGNGWFRVSMGITTVSGGTSATVQIRVFDSTTTNSYAGDATKGLFIWGMQLEQGFFLTSYIQTTGSSATRNADVATMGPTVAPLKTTGPEIIVNGTFDTDSDWIDDDQGTGSGSISGGKLVLSGDDFANRSMRYQQVTLVDGERYRLSFDKFDDQMVVRVGTSLQGDELVSATFSSTASGGESFNYDFTANGTTAYVRFIHQNTGISPSGTSRIDNVSLKKIQDGTELVSDPGFDSGVGQWVGTANATVSHDTSNLDVEVAADTTSGTFLARYRVHDEATIIEGRRYRITLDVTRDAGSATYFIRAYGDESFTDNIGQSSDASGASATLSIDCTAPSTEQLEIILIRGGTRTVSDAFSLDNLSVRELYPFEAYNPAEGTMYSLSSCTGDDTHTVLSMHADSFDNYFSHTYRFGNSLRNFSKGGGSTELQTAEAVTLSNRNEIATTYDGTSMDMSANGSDETTGTLGADIVGIHEIAFGLRYTANQYSGHIERVQYFPRALPKVTLQSLTSD
tara:strand:+ start:1694 stop:4972 length:3279 start_codon:yes stop_codon:yes gene_type:complete